MKYFDHTFWKVSALFCVCIAVVLSLLIALGYYNDKMYGPENLLDMQRAQRAPEGDAAAASSLDQQPTNFVR